MLALLGSTILSALPNTILSGFRSWLDHRAAVADSQEKTKREVTIRQIDAIMEAQKQAAETQRAAMSHRPFWVVWMLFALPLGVWWAAVVMDTVFLFSGSIPDLPESIKPWADMIFMSLFGSGAGVAGATLIAKAVATRR